MSGMEQLKAELGRLADSQRAQSVPGETKPRAADDNQKFDRLRIEQRTLETPTRTIAIHNISHLQVMKLLKTRQEKSDWHLNSARRIFFASLGLIVLATITGLRSSLSIVLLVSGLLGVAIALTVRRRGEKSVGYFSHRLDITTNDGMTTVFTSNERNFVDGVRSILSEKINKADETAVFNINFEKGVIETLNAGSLDVGALVQGDNNQVAANSPGARVGTVEKTYHAENSPGAQVGEGNVATGIATHATISNISTVNYAAHLPTIADWRNFYAQHPDGRMIEQRLAELETLMKSGTPTPKSRGRLKDVALDLSMILQGYPAMVQVFRDIVRLAGF